MSRPKLIIYGNGTMASLFLFFARTEFEVVAFTVDRSLITEPTLESLPVIPFDEISARCPPANHTMITAVGFVEMNRVRQQKYQEAQAMGYRFGRYVHPSVVRHANVEIGENTVVLDHVAIHPYSRLGKGVFVCSNASFGHGCVLDDFCWVNSGVSVGGETHVGPGCFLGINATLADNISLGAHCYVGANTLVASSTQTNEVLISASAEKFPLDSAAFLRFITRRH